MRFLKLIVGVAMLTLGTAIGSAQAPARPSYGADIGLETPKKVAAGAMAEARKQKWNVAIVDNHGMLIYYEMMDDTSADPARRQDGRCHRRLGDGLATGRASCARGSTRASSSGEQRERAIMRRLSTAVRESP